MERDEALLMNTRVGDDIDMLVCLVSQLADNLPVNDSDPDPYLVSTQIPDPTCHCKYWEEIDLKRFAEIMERKYKSAPRLEIPAKFKTGW